MIHYRISKPVLVLISLVISLIAGYCAAADQPERGNVDFPRFPSISPDGSQVVFSWRGDLWKVSSTGGQALRLTSHLAEEFNSAWSPDGKQIAFDSMRDGFRNIYIMNEDGSGLKQITYSDRSCNLTGWGKDEQGNQVLTFHGVHEYDIYREHRPYMVSVDGGDFNRIHDAFGSHPVIGPGSNFVAFSRGAYFYGWSRRHGRGPETQDVWLYNRSNQSFKQLTSWPGNDGYARFATPRRLIYMSDRELECVNLYRIEISNNEPRPIRLTSFKDNDVQGFDVSADGTTAIIAVWDTLYTLDIKNSNATPQALTINASEDESDNYQILAVNKKVSEAQLSPDGKVMAYVAYGEIFVRNIEDKSPTRRITNSHANDRDIAWSPDGVKLYFSSDRDGSDSIFAATVVLTRSEVKEDFDEQTKPKDVVEEEEPEEEDDEDEEADEDESIEEPKAQEAKANLAAEANEEDDDDDEKDEKEDEKEDKEEDLPKELDSKRWHDALAFDINPVIQTESNDRYPSPSPDGTKLAMKRTRGDLVIHDLETGDEHTIAEGWDFWIHWQWSPDSKFIAYAQSDLDFNSDIFIAAIDGSTETFNVTRHPDNEESPQWSADGKILSFVSERVNEEFDVWMVYLDPDLESLTPKELDEYYKEAAKVAKKRKPLKPKVEEEEDDEEEDEDDDAEEEVKDDLNWDLETAYLRLRRITTLSGNETGLAMTPAGDRYIFNGTAGERALYSVKWDGKDRKKVTSTADVQHITLSGDKLVIVTGSRAATVKPAGGDLKYIDIKHDIRIDLQEQASQKFLEMARRLGTLFYHPTMKDLDWTALTSKYHQLAMRTRSADEFNHVANRLLGELTGSHLGVRGRGAYSSPNRKANGRLGTIHHRVDDGFKVTKVIPQSPASKGSMAIKTGDIITAIDGKTIGQTDTIASMLKGLTGTETLVTVKRSIQHEGEDAQIVELNLLITPISYNAMRQLAYYDWRSETAESVSQMSDGRLGYIHIQSMGQAALDIFERDLFAAAQGREGLVIDVRNNGGGWTTDRLLSSIMVQPHAYTIPRGADPTDTGHYPQDRLFIWRYSQPINMLCNEKSFSNAEIISHAFKALKRGTLVGQETWGGVISTGGFALIDGSTVRLPFRGWHLMDGTNMENHGAVPDIIVTQTPEAEAVDDDEQLRAAVVDLLMRLDK
ncbi:MAG: PD40 domain-containing protein [Planctomycetes bacterium]|nr:PD40 domain-containing protein [Planctomycetota bacterium]